MSGGKRRGEQLWQEQYTWQMKVLDYLNTGELTGVDLEALGFEGTITPEAGALLEQAFGEAAQLTDDPLEAERQAALSTMMSGAGSYQMDAQAMEDLYKTTIEIPMMRHYEENIKEGVAHKYMTRGQTGPAIQQGYNAGRQVMEGLMGEKNKLLNAERMREFESKENAMNRMGYGAQLSQNENIAKIEPLRAMMGMGQEERNIRGQFSNERMQRLLAAQPWNDPRLGMSGLGFQMPGANQPSGGGGMGGMVQGLAGLAALGAPYFGPAQATKAGTSFF